MKTTYNKSIPKFLKPKIEEALKLAEAFIAKKFPEKDLSGSTLNFSATRNGSMYYHADGSINIACRHKLHLYRKVSCKLTTPPQGLNIGYVLATACAIIHEVTHYVQGMEGRSFSEVETTQNEIDFLKESDVFWYKQLIPAS